MPSAGTGQGLGSIEELGAGGAQGTREVPCPLWMCRGRAGPGPPPSLLPRGGGCRARLPIWRSQSRRWQYFKVWYILSLPGICMYFLSSACYDKSVKI